MKRLIVSLIIVLSPTCLWAQTTSNAPQVEGYAVLAGFTEFDLQARIELPKADTQRVRSAMELKLRQSGVRIESTALAYLAFDCVGKENAMIPIVAYTCRLYVRMPVLQNFPTDRIVMADVWSTQAVIADAGSNKAREALTQTMEGLVTNFLNDWLRANPKR